MGSDFKVDNNSEEPSCYFPTRQEPNIKLNVKVTNGGPHTFLVSQPRRELNVAVPLLKVGQVPDILATRADVQQNRAIV